MAEQTGRKGSVTQTGTQATSLSSPDLRAASFSREGVVDQSGLFKGEATAAGLSGIAGGIKDFGQIALDVDEGIAKAQLERNILDEIDRETEARDPEFEERQQESFDDAAIDLSVKEQTREILKEKEGEGAAIEATDPDFADITRRLTNAKRKGSIGVSEFETRIKAATREAISRRPGLINELRAHAENVLDLNGARERFKLEDQLAQMEQQSQQKILDTLEKQLDRANIVFDRFNRDPFREQQLLNTKREQDQVYEEGKRIREINAAVSQEEGLAILRQKGSMFGAGAFNRASEAMLAEFREDMSSKELTVAKVKANNIVAELRDEFRQMGTGLSVTNHQDFKDLRDNWLGSIENLSKILETAGSGKEAADIAKNYMTVIQSSNKRDVFNMGINTEALRAGQLLASFAPLPALLEKQFGFADMLPEIYTNLLQSGVNHPSLSRALQTNIDNKNSLSVILSESAKTTLPTQQKPTTAGNSEDFDNMVNTVVGLLDKKITTNQDKVFSAQTDIVRQLSDPQLREHLDNANATTKTTLVDLAMKQASVLEPDRNRFLDRAKQEGVIISPRVLPNGTLSFATDNQTPRGQQLLREFNNKFTTKYNDLIKFHANLFNMSVPQASELLGEIYGGGSREDIERAISGRKDQLNENPVNTVIKSRIKGEEGFREEAYLDQAGIPTIGYGFTTINGKPVQLGDTITPEQAELELDKQVKAHTTFRKKLSVPLSETQEEALASFEYNLGPNIWNGSGKSIIDAINAGDLERAAEILKRHNKVRDPGTGELVENRGLVRRRDREASLLLGET